MTALSTTAGTVTSPASSGPKISESAAKWFQSERGISRETLECLPVASGTTFFPALSAKSEAIFFKYDEGWKARAIPSKDFVAAKGWKPSFWNLNAVLEAISNGGGDVFITEGELDAMALVESGIPYYQVLSVPNGASGKVQDENDDRGLPYLIEGLKDGLNKAKQIIFCGDSDEPGLALRATMAMQFGPAKFSYVDWPDQCKDANDVLRLHGPIFLRNHILGKSKQWPVDGLYRISELPEPPKLTLWEPELECLRGKLYLAPRTLSVVTGQPGHGKSTLWGQLWFEIIKKYDLTGCFASFETRPKPHMRRQLRTLFNKGIHETALIPSEIEKADNWIEEHYLFLQHHEQRPTLDWFLDRAEVAVIRHGARIIQVDPWNRLEASRGRDENETEYIGRCLRALHVFAHDMNCHVQILAHPAKMDNNRKGRAPELEDISGSKNWDNMVDQGFVVHRPTMFKDGERKTEATLITRKSRFEELGYPLLVWLNYDLQKRTYVPLADPIEEEEKGAALRGPSLLRSIH